MTQKGKADLKVGNIMLRKREHEVIIKRTLFLHRRTTSIHFTPAADSRTEQVSFYLLFNFHSQFTNKSVGFPWFHIKKRLTYIFNTQQRPAGAGRQCGFQSEW